MDARYGTVGPSDAGCVSVVNEDECEVIILLVKSRPIARVMIRRRRIEGRVSAVFQFL